MNPSPSSSSLPLLAARGIGKSFAGNAVLESVDFEVHGGRIVALCGENGAGKSTLIKILSGVYAPSEGLVELEGVAVAFSGPRESMSRGLAVVHQEFSTIGALSVAENIYLEAEPANALGFIDRRRLDEGAAALMNDLGIDLDPHRPVADLGVAEQQMVEIAKALRSDAKILILDEPTAVLSQPETEHLFRIVGVLRRRGMGLVYVSHRLHELFEIADDLVALKDGQVTAAGPIGDYDHDSVVAAMVGREMSRVFPAPKPPATETPVLAVAGLRVHPHSAPVDLTLRAGEIVGLAGLVGSGRTEVLRQIYGADDSDAKVAIKGADYSPRTPSRSLAYGIAMLTESRKADGVFPESAVAANFVATSMERERPWYWLSARDFMRRAQRLVGDFKVRLADVDQSIDGLSGGNQQKVLLARLLENDPGILLLDEPTRGVDVGAKAEIYKQLRALADRGVAILMVSSELIEIVGLCNRAYVMRGGDCVGGIRDRLTEEAIIALATG